MPPTPDERATERSSDRTGLPPTRTWRSAPGRPARDRRTDVIVTVRPRSSSRPVPPFPLRSEVAYHWLVQGVAGSPLSARAAICGLSPSAVPAGPNAVTLAGVRVRTATGVGESVGDREGWAEVTWADGVTDGSVAGWPATRVGRGAVAAAGWCAWPTPATNS